MLHFNIIFRFMLRSPKYGLSHSEFIVYNFYFVSQLQKCFSLSKVRLTDRAVLHHRGTPNSLIYITLNGMVNVR
jgi:hypothetical protein